MVTRIAILTPLLKPRLTELAAGFDINCSRRSSKQDLLAALRASRKYTTADLLQRLSHKELQLVCQHNGYSTTGKNKQQLIYDLNGDDRLLLKSKIISTLRKQGFRSAGNTLRPPELKEKSAIRALHDPAVAHRRERAAPGLQRHEDTLLNYIADANVIDTNRLSPRLVEVKRGSIEELLFRYACLHWSIPVSSGYGRRLRFLVMDNQNNKLIGVIGLGDPVFALSPRDQWIGFRKGASRPRLRNLLDAFVLGAVPPYSHFLCGKLVAMLAASNEVRQVFTNKYGSSKSLISEGPQDGGLALLTTVSALGRSSIYNRIRHNGNLLYRPVGYTRGYGDFQFMNGLYDELFDYAKSKCDPTAKQANWGTGFRNRREVVKKCLKEAGLSGQLLRHGVQRQVYVVPLASNAEAFLRGDADCIEHADWPLESLASTFKARWLEPRATRLAKTLSFDKQSYRIWNANC